ncbi:hypothetical protein ULMS_24310 [Patiriisocius marinistellae]|uniref:Putative auto-transporter adhesin head GIN domain-containing protein n=1 Tax=Patiriisocius marinistellae TaxID=2494560 RepID=A0A5J4FXZ1_9FLAO|nr:head GIN domain-containing protein [Patiriisocius marinistellae]GEQ86923.1 hypothetical protein ULMS_24310 [Patiriisocius marinistellae]
MRHILYIFITLGFISCDDENSSNCFQTAGDIVTSEVSIAAFNKILVWEQVTLFIEEGDTQKVRIETGENLLKDIELVVIDDQLNIYDNNSCNFLRDYGITKVYVTSPNITEIRSSTGFPISSIGTLNYPEIKLISEDQGVSGITHTDGDFNITLATEKLDIISNGFAIFKIDGTATNASMSLFAGNTGIEARNLVVEKLNLYHRSSNNMYVNPIQSIRGQIVSFGNVVSVNMPDFIAVEELFDGRLLFE